MKGRVALETENIKVVDQFKDRLFQLMTDESVYRYCSSKKSTVVLLPYDFDMYCMSALARLAKGKKHDIPEYDGYERFRDSDLEEVFTVNIVDGSVVFGTYCRESDGTDRYEPTTMHIARGKRPNLSALYKKIGFHSSEALIAYADLMKSVKGKINREIVTSAIHRACWIKGDDIYYEDRKPVKKKFIQITQELIDGGFEIHYHPFAYKHASLGATMFSRPMKAGDVILQDLNDEMKWRLISAENFKTFYNEETTC